MTMTSLAEEATALAERALPAALWHPLGEAFRLADLFDSAEWEGIDVLLRRRAGAVFHSPIREGHAARFAFWKTSDNHWNYERRA